MRSAGADHENERNRDGQRGVALVVAERQRGWDEAEDSRDRDRLEEDTSERHLEPRLQATDSATAAVQQATDAIQHAGG